MRENHEIQVDTLVSQLNEMNIKIKNLKILRKEEIKLNNKLSSLQESLYTKLYDIKEQHEKVL
jgi:hypothetical protein